MASTKHRGIEHIVNDESEGHQPSSKKGTHVATNWI